MILFGLFRLFPNSRSQNYLPITDQPMYNIVPTTPTYLEEFNDTKMGQNTAENDTIFEIPENCIKCIEKCGFYCRNSCYANLDCNTTNFDYYDDSNYTEISNETCDNCAANYFDDSEKLIFNEIPEINIPFRGDLEEDDLDPDQLDVGILHLS